MDKKNLFFLNTLTELTELLSSINDIKLYGAGDYLGMFLNEIPALNEIYYQKISCIMVSDMRNNPTQIMNIPVIEYHNTVLNSEDHILLTLGHRFTDEVYDLLKDTGAKIYQINFNMFQEIPYQEIKNWLQPFIDTFTPHPVPIATDKVYAWTCWWQGEALAPDIVHVCWKSQRRNLPQNVEHIIITKNNYQKYFTLPESILENVESGKITFTTLSDIIRSVLLYKYGGFWLDSTLLLTAPLEEDILDYPVYTRHISETHFCSNAVWVTWFFYAKPGSLLFQFISEGFFYFFSVYDEMKYYYAIDYMIGIASNTFPIIERQLREIPYNNESSTRLQKHLTEPFDQYNFEQYIADSPMQKITYKVNRDHMTASPNTIYDHLLQMK